MLRNFTLSIELHEHAIFYHWSYSPPVKNAGGSCGRVYPDGALFGVPFDELVSLGAGNHEIQLDERIRTTNGTKPQLNDEEHQLELFKMAVFGYKHGVFTETELLKHSLLSFTRTNAETVLKISPDFLIQSLTEYASRVPQILADRTSDSFDFFSSAGSTRIPDGNLQLLNLRLSPKNTG